MSDFGKAQLLKYGWSEGKGLGKNENGIAEALKPKLKFDTSGIGHKHTDYDWWNSVYDKALNNVVLEKKGDDISINVAKENAFNISSSKSGLEVQKKEHSLHYGKFLKTSTLQDGNMIRDNTCEVVEDNTEDDPTIIKLTDEELFKACGGRTAHKGARHGLTLNGKLSRIAEQEKQLLAGSFSKNNEAISQYTEIKQKKKKKRKKESMETEENPLVPVDAAALDEDDCLIPRPLSETEENYVPSKKNKKKVKRKIHDLTRQLNKSCTIQDDATHGGEEKPQKKQKLSNDTYLDGTSENKKKKSKRKRDDKIVHTNCNDIYLNINNKTESKGASSSVPNSDYISDDHDGLIIPSPVQVEQNCKLSKRSLRKVKRKIHDLTHQLNKSCMIQDDSIDDDEKKSSKEKREDHRKMSKKSKNKSKKKSKEKRDQETVSTALYDDDVPMEPCNKKLRKSDTDSSEVFCDVEQSDESSERGYKKNASSSSKKQKYTYCPNTETKRLNEKIRLKKIKKLQRKERKRGGGVTVEESTTSESDIKESKPSRKKCKKNKKKIIAVD